MVIDENEIEASHSAHIGTVDYIDVLYLMRLGISYQGALRLIIKGLLTNNIEH